MAKQTKSQRIEAKVAGGLTYIEAEIEIEQEDAGARLARLKERQEKEDARVRGIVVELLEAEHPDVFRELQSKARRQMASQAQRRRERAKRGSESMRPEHHHGGVAGQPEHAGEA